MEIVLIRVKTSEVCGVQALVCRPVPLRKAHMGPGLLPAPAAVSGYLCGLAHFMRCFLR